MSDNIVLKFLNPQFYSLLLEVIKKVNPEFHEFIVANSAKLTFVFIFIGAFQDVIEFYKECRDAGLKLTLAELKNTQFYIKISKLILAFVKTCCLFGNKNRIALVIQCIQILFKFAESYWKNGKQGLKEEMGKNGLSVFSSFLDSALSFYKKEKTSLTDEDVVTSKAQLLTACRPIIVKMDNRISH